MNRWVFMMAGCLVVAAVTLTSNHHAPRNAPKPTDGMDEPSDYEQRRRAWIELIHMHAPGVDWAAQDAATRQGLEARRLQQQALLARNAQPVALTAAPPGIWRERGAGNWAGRASAFDYDPATGRMTVFAHGGQLWRATRGSTGWQSLNDARHFRAQDAVQNFVRLNGSGIVPERLVAADDSAHGFFYSDDGGATWTQAAAATGSSFPANWYETSYLAARDANDNRIYALVADSGTAVYQAYLLVSADRGATWTNLGLQGDENKTALFAMGQGSGLVYLLNGATLYRVETANTLTSLGTISGPPTQAANDKVGIAGGIALATPFFYAFYEVHAPPGPPPSNDATYVFLSLDEGGTWTPAGANATSPLPTASYIRVAAGTSLSNPQIACYGGIDLYCTHDGGASFAYVNDWPDYYPNVGTALHADISFVRSYLTASNQEVFFIGTDGGLFESTDGVTTVQNDSPTGLRSGEYYASYTGRNPPYYLAIGAQDQGYQNNGAPASGIATYIQGVSGDYADLASSDSGATLWLNYAGATLVDATPGGHPLTATANTLNLPTWDFEIDGHLDKAAMLFLPPLLAYPGYPDSALLSTATANGAGGDTYQVTQLTFDGASTISATGTGSFDFGGNATALVNSGSTFFATANVGGATGASFFTTSTPLGDWSKTVTTLPQGTYFTAQCILPDPARAGTLYVCGSGYSNPGVYVSTNSGGSFTAMNTGLPDTLVYSLAITPDGANLFAATEVGPFYYDRGSATWLDITVGSAGTRAPASTYWHVDFVPALNVARFSSYGRGIWDYDLGGGDLIFRHGFE